ncbi:PAS domain S-box protein [candidate division KSB1 bacterium]|nr:PAS domain S-box protein [candidate division KSB1 bacterium]
MDVSQELILKVLQTAQNHDDLNSLMKSVTSLMREWSGCDAVGIRLQEGDDFPYFETKGFPEEFVKLEMHLCNYDPNGQVERDSCGNVVLECMCGNVIEGRFDPSLPFFTDRGSFWSNSTTLLLASTSEADRQSRTRNRCNGEGYESVALIPLCNKEKRYGLLQFNDKRKDRFTAEKIKLLEQLADGLSVFISLRKLEDELRQREEQYRIISGLTSDYAYMFDVQADDTLKLKWVTDAFEIITGYKPDESEKRSGWATLVHPNDLEIGRKRMLKLLAGKQDVSVFRIITKTGDIRWVKDFGQPVVGDDGKVIRIYGAVQDITERRHERRKLKETERRFRVLLENVRLIAVIIDRDGYISFANDYFVELLGCDRNDILGRNWFELFIPPEMQQRMTSIYKQIMDGKPEYTHLENEIITCGGRRLLVMWSNVVLHDTSGNIVGIASIGDDITEQRRTEQELRTSENKYRELMQQSNDAIYLLYENRFELVNRKFLELFELEMEYLKKPDFDIWQLIAPKSHALVKSRLAKIKSGEKVPRQYEFCVRTSTGKEIDVEASVTHFQYENGIATQGILRNISDRKRLEQQLLQSQKMEAIGTLAGGIAHDFNNLLTAILGNTDLLLEAVPKNSAIYPDVHEIKVAAERAASLTQQLLAYGRRQPLNLQKTDVNKVIVGMINMLKRIIGEDITISKELEPIIRPIHADVGQLNQLIMNLVINARDALCVNGRIIIRTKNVKVDEAFCKQYVYAKPGDYVVISIQDNGSGIPENVRAKMFEPFFSTKKFGRGTGLGLSVVYGIVKQHDGWINVESVVNEGSTFHIYFPVNTSETPVKMELESEPKEYRGRGQTILFVEDDEVVRKSIAKLLCTKGFDVLSAESAEKARAIFQNEQKRIRLLFSDIRLTDSNGIDLATELRRFDPSLQILLSSGYADSEMQWPIIRKLGYRFLAKPYHFPALLATIDELLAENLDSDKNILT